MEKTTREPFTHCGAALVFCCHCCSNWNIQYAHIRTWNMRRLVVIISTLAMARSPRRPNVFCLSSLLLSISFAAAIPCHYEKYNFIVHTSLARSLACTDTIEQMTNIVPHSILELPDNDDTIINRASGASGGRWGLYNNNKTPQQCDHVPWPAAVALMNLMCGFHHRRAYYCVERTNDRTTLNICRLHLSGRISPNSNSSEHTIQSREARYVCRRMYISYWVQANKRPN